MDMVWLAYAKGLVVMASLIVAIGAQNAFVLRQGVRQEGMFLTAAICFLCDIVLVMTGAAGLGALFAANRWLNITMALGGALFLACYGIRSLHAAKTAKGLNLRAADKVSRKSIILTAFAVSLLNPHVYIDTLVLVGGLAGRYEGAIRAGFVSGVITVSGVWFFGLVYGAKRLAPILTKPKIWRTIDLVIGLMMLALAVGLARDGVLLLRQ